MAHEKTKEWFCAYVRDLQDRIVQEMQELDPALAVTEDHWDRLDYTEEPGGGGRTRFLEGEVFENAGVNVSCVYGRLSPDFSVELGGKENDRLWASGISLILHPRNPRVPTVHANFRMVQLGERVWFGGGADLTPHYPNLEDFAAFHGSWKEALSDLGTYPQWKVECDRYFTNHHRDGEMRGVGGVFFDRFRRGTVEEDSKTVAHLSETFIPSYFPIAKLRAGESYTQQDEDFMLHRRGRYVEFNLLHDRGTHFGLRSNGRTHSILVSLPARARFGYQWEPAEGSVHEEMMQYYRPRDWA